MDLQNLDLNLIAWVVGVVLLLLGLMKKGKDKKTGKIWVWAGAGLLVVGLALPYFGFDLFGSIAGGTTTATVVTTTPTSSDLTVCDLGTKTTVTLSAQNAYTSVASGGTHRYKINGSPALTVSDASTFTASPGDKLDILWGNETDSSYYGVVSSETVPCAGTKTYSKKLYQNGTLTVRVFNENGDLITTTGTNETLAAGDIVNLPIEVQGTFQRGYPYGFYVVAEYNKTSVDDVVVQLGGNVVSTPQIYAITLGTEAATKTYSVPAILSNQEIEGTIVIDADDTNNPTVAGSDVILTFYPLDYYINEDNGGSYDGPDVEDEDNVQTFGHSTAFTVQVD